MSLFPIVNRLSRKALKPLWKPSAFFENDLDDVYSMDRSLTNFMPKINVKETPGEIVITSEIPGIKKEDLKLEFSDGLLTLSGKKHEEKEEKDSKYYRSERVFGEFKRSLQLPEGIKETDINATQRHGILEVKIKKPEASKEEFHKEPSKIEIQEQKEQDEMSGGEHQGKQEESHGHQKKKEEGHHGNKGQHKEKGGNTE